MPVEQIIPLEAYSSLDNRDEVSYVDVRTVGEFAVRHPKASKIVNIPIVFFHPTTKETHPNDSFLLVANDVFKKDAHLIVGADDGDRATQAADMLVADGFTNVRTMTQGMTGWQRVDLPVTADNRPGISYVSLLTPAKRRK